MTIKSKIKINDDTTLDLIQRDILSLLPGWYYFLLRYGLVISLIFLCIFNFFIHLPIPVTSAIFFLILSGNFYLSEIYVGPFINIKPESLKNNTSFIHTEVTKKLRDSIHDSYGINIDRYMFNILSKGIRTKIVNNIKFKYFNEMYLLCGIVLVVSIVMEWN